MSKPIVYLAGGIAGLPYAGATSWRHEVAAYLHPEIATLSPMRWKNALEHSDNGMISTDFREYAHNGPFYTAQGIMERDYNDVRRADLLLVNLLGANSFSIGTCMELAWAYAMQKPVVVAIEKEGNPHMKHPMVSEAMGAFRYDELYDACMAARTILGV